MKPIPTIEELVETARREGGLFKGPLIARCLTAPLFAAIQERDAEIEKLRGLMSEAYDCVASIHGGYKLPLDCKFTIANIASLLDQRNGTTEPEPAKPETFEAKPDPHAHLREAEAQGKSVEEHILEFATSQWGEKTMDRLVSKLAEETGEIAGAIVKIPEGRASEEDLDKELGDALIVLSQFAAKRGHTLEQLRAKRFEQIKERATTRPPCAACDRGDYQLGHSDECAKKNEAPVSVKPWTLPAPPEGRQWHRTDWTEDMLPEGWRPLLLGEHLEPGDQGDYGDSAGFIHFSGGNRTQYPEYHYRTRRPLPEPETWIDLGPDDVPMGSTFKLPNKTQGVWAAALYVSADGVYFATGFESWGNLNNDGFLINRSLSTGKWDAEAWEPCRKRANPA